MAKENKTAYDIQYRKNNYKQINFAQTTEYIDSIETYCKARGIKKNTFIKLCIDKEMALHPIEQYTMGAADQQEKQEEQQETTVQERTIIEEEQKQEDVKQAIKDIKSEIIKAIIDGLHVIE